MSLAPGKVIVEDLAFTHWTNNHPWWFLNPGSHALQCVFDVCDLKGEGKKRAKAKEKETRYASLAIFVCR